MEKKYTINEGLESLERIKLMIGYNPTMTLNENIESNLNNLKKRILLESDNEKNTGMFKDFTPTQGEGNYFPDGTKILKRMKDMGGKIKMTWDIESGGNEQTEKWVKTNWISVFNPEGVYKFQTPDKKIYYAHFSNKILDKIKTWDEFYAIPVDNNLKNWYFAGYTDEQGKRYNQPKPIEDPWYVKVGDWLVENWQLVAEIVVSVVVGIATVGQSLWIQAACQMGVATAFAIDDIAKGDWWTAGISLAIASVPMVGRLAKFGTKAPSLFLEKYGSKLASLKDSPVAMKAFFEGLNETDKIIFSRALQQTKGEMKKNVSKTLVQNLQKSVKNGVIELSKIPLAQKLWWKELFVEGGVALSVGFGLGLVKLINQEQKTKTKITKEKYIGSERQKYYKSAPIEKQIAASDSSSMDLQGYNYDEEDY